MKCKITLASFREHAIQFQHVKKHAEGYVVCMFRSTGNRRLKRAVICVKWACNDLLLSNMTHKSLDTVQQMLINWEVICATEILREKTLYM